MARSRNIKPSLFKNELLGVADPMLTILFSGLWCLADRAGRLEDRPLRIKAEIFPYRDNTNINVYLTELERLGFIHRYSVDGLNIIQVVNFDKHQNPHKTERPSELPEYSLESDSCEITVKHTLSDVEITEAAVLIPDSLNLIPDSRFPITDTPAKAVAIKQPKASLSKTDLVTIGFDEQLAEDYLTLRKAKKLPLTKTALINIVREGAECGLNPNQTLNHCITSSWAGFKKDWYLKDNAQGKKVSVISDFLKDPDFDF